MGKLSDLLNRKLALLKDIYGTGTCLTPRLPRRKGKTINYCTFQCMTMQIGISWCSPHRLIPESIAQENSVHSVHFAPCRESPFSVLGLPLQAVFVGRNLEMK